ncbi:hypothetical protein ACFIJ5_13940 [Haloimpatiens sp. FM7330]|uniref:hypothetical protein n=1 Tax=Haloimpatiens sp. FM7330 TaxID=3298610 RepID=UPI00363F2A16
MYRIINENIDNLLGEKLRKHFKDYEYLLDNLYKVNVAEDIEYQRNYRKFYAMNVARLPKEFYKCYFNILQNNKNESDISLQYVVKKLNNKELYKKEKGKIQFSFSSKLVHMINNKKPIYDSKIANFYNLPKLNKNNYNETIKKMEMIYGSIDKEYDRIIKEKLLFIPIKKVRNYFELGEKFTDTKIIDSIIWMYISYAESGIGKIKYK